MGYAQQNSQKSVVDGYAEAGAIATEVRGALAVFRSAIPLLSSVIPLLSILSGVGFILLIRIRCWHSLWHLTITILQHH